MCRCDTVVISPEVLAELRSRPEITLGTIREQTAHLPDETIVRVDAGSNFDAVVRPEQVGLVENSDRYRNPGNNVRIFGLELGEGVLWLEL
jgi:hypothetical protein